MCLGVDRRPSVLDTGEGGDGSPGEADNHKNQYPGLEVNGGPGEFGGGDDYQDYGKSDAVKAVIE